MTALAFELLGVGKTAGVGDGKVRILDDIHLRVPLGQYLSIVGPSGSGKTTLMQILGCLDQPSEGRVRVLGRDIGGMNDDDVSLLRCQSIGFVFQAFHLLAPYDAVANVALAMVYSGRRDRQERARRLLCDLGLSERLHHKPTTLSGGEKQRVAVARAIANDPPILLADEPTGALDQANGQAVLEIFDRLHRSGRTIVLVTHDPGVARRAERVVEIVDGHVRRDVPGASFS